MKKLLSFLAAGVLAFGLIGCSGDLHDVSLIDLTGYGIIGSMTGWKTDTSLLKANKDGTYTFEFIYSDGAAFAVNKDDDWSTAYRWDGDTSAKNAVKFTAKDTPVKVYCGDSPYCMTLPCASTGDTVSVLITPAATYLEMTVSIKVAEPMYVAIDNAVAEMEPTGNEGEYSYTVTGTGSDVEFKVFDGTDSYGLVESGYATNSISLVKGGKNAIKLATGADCKYAIYVTKSSEGLSVITKDASYKTMYNLNHLNACFGSDLTWEAQLDGSYVATVQIEKGLHENSWWMEGSEEDSIEDVKFGFAVNDTTDTGWTHAFRGKDITVDAENATGLEISSTDATVTGFVGTWVSDDDYKPKAEGKPGAFKLEKNYKMTITSTDTGISVKVDTVN